jgi:GntR family transcriptional regulator
MPSLRNGTSKRAATAPRYQQVADDLTKRIGSGKYPVGGYLPTEMELCDQYAISRHTVREALRQLRDAGLISRRRRIGTEVADAALAEMLECREGTKWLRVNSLRAVPGDSRPVCMTTAYLDLRLPDLEKNLEALTGPISAMLERVYGIRIARIEQSIQAVRLGKRQAKLLRALDGGPALRAIRRYYDRQGRLVELSNAIHPGERFTYVTSLVRT